MEKKFLRDLRLSNRRGPERRTPSVPAVSKIAKAAWILITFCALLAFPGVTAARDKHVDTEFLEEAIQNGMASADIIALLDQTVGAAASTGGNRGIPQQLRQGLYVTALRQSSNIILRFEVDGSGTQPRYTIAEVAVSADLGRRFLEFIKAALGTAESVFSAAPQFAKPWELALNAQSSSGGEVTIKVEGDATAHFTLSWDIASPKRPLDSFVVPTAFGSKEAGTDHINVVVHFPITLEAFTFLRTIYVSGVPQRYQDLPLSPHTWLHLTVTNGSTDRFVIVHFDAITVSGQRLFVAEGPASTDVGGRFLNESITRMQEMLNEEAAKPGSSGKWATEFYYDDPNTGVIVVAVTGEQGTFDAAYEIQTPIQNVRQHGKSTVD
jgi:hypothetical protein